MNKTQNTWLWKDKKNPEQVQIKRGLLHTQKAVLEKLTTT